jgi:hypothetical protein
MPTNAKKNLDLRFIFHAPPPDFRRSTTGGALDAHLLEGVGALAGRPFLFGVGYGEDDVGFAEAQVVAQTIEGAATEEAAGIVVRGGGVVDLVTAVVLEQAYELGLDAAGEENAAAVDLFPGIVAGMTAVSMTVKRSQEKSAG